MNYLKYSNTLYLINFLSIYSIFLFAKWEEDVFHRLSKRPEHKASIHNRLMVSSVSWLLLQNCDHHKTASPMLTNWVPNAG